MCVCAFERDSERDLNCECKRRRERENWHVGMCGIEIKRCLLKETMSRHDDKICEILP